jgi:ADP-ribosylglycohydrolase
MEIGKIGKDSPDPAVQIAQEAQMLQQTGKCCRRCRRWHSRGKALQEFTLRFSGDMLSLAMVLTRNHVCGAIYGHLVGDAFGVPYEFKRPDELPAVLDWMGHGTHNQPVGTWSDDGALMLCSAASLASQASFDAADQAERFIRWYAEGYMAAGGVVFDVGRTTSQAIQRMQWDIEPLKAGPADPSHNGNGSLMRILPVSLWCSRLNIEEMLRLSHQASCLTHGHYRSQICCAIHTLLIRFLIEGLARDHAWHEAMEAARRAYSGPPYGEDEQYGQELALVEAHGPGHGSGYVVDCLHSAWHAFQHSDDYASAIRAAVRFGNDTDTTAAVAGGLAGLWFGVKSIPRKWRRELRLSKEQRAAIDEFAALLVD